MKLLIIVTFMAVTLTQVTSQEASQAQAESQCTFPRFLTVRSRWETAILKEHTRTNGYYKFQGSEVEIRDYKSKDKRVVKWVCEKELPDNKFILKMDMVGVGGNLHFVCMQFFERSKSIIQRKVSQVEGRFTESICDDDNMAMDDWPIVWPDLDNDYSECPFQGGYAIDIREYIHDKPLCGGAWIKPRMESECIKGEGLTIDFRHFECIGNLGMSMVQKLSCLGSWEDGDFTFTILTDQNDLWPKLWLMRLVKKQLPDGSAHTEAVLSQDIVADRAEFFGNDGLVPLERLYGMILTTEMYPSLCEDEAEVCEDVCGSSNKVFCQKECGICNSIQNLQNCQFAEEARGEWQEITENKSRDIQITESMLYVDDLMPFQCYELYADKWFEDTGRKALVTVFNNGCKPRYTCAEFQLKSEHVMTYRLSQSLVWPATKNVNAQDVCEDKRFQNDVQPLKTRYRSQDTKILVKKQLPHEDRRTVPCNLESTMGLSGIAKDGKRLLGVLWNSVAGYETADDTLMHEVCVNTGAESLGQAFHSSRLLKCLASYKENNNTHFLVVEEDGNPLNTECWVIHQHEWEFIPRVYILHPSDCSPSTPEVIDFRKSTTFIAKYDPVIIDNDAMDPCSKWKTTLKIPKTNLFTVSPKLDTDMSSGQDLEAAVTGIEDTSLPEEWTIRVAGQSKACRFEGIVWLVLMSILVLGWLEVDQ